MRADFLHRAAEHHQLAQAISSQNIISPLRREELQAAIARPAEAVGCCFEQGLVDELIEETLNQPGALPLLEYTLQELWVDRRSDGTLTWTEFRTLGGVAGALGRRADNILEECYPSIEQHDELRAILLQLEEAAKEWAASGKEIELDAVKDHLAKYDAVHFDLRRQLEDPMFSRSFGERHQELF